MLKCDIRKFFANIDHSILINIFQQYIPNNKLIELLKEVIGSFSSGKAHVGLPLGNLTSQVLVNIYMNKFDQFVKHELRVTRYIRYADDFVISSESASALENILPRIREFLQNKLKLKLHPHKVSIATLASGIDFLGWVHFPNHRVLRTNTRARMMKKIAITQRKATLNSYLGLLKHGNAHTLREMIFRQYLVREPEEFSMDSNFFADAL